MSLNRMLSKRATHIKGDNYAIDPMISDTYLVRVLLERVAMKLRGAMNFPRRKSVIPFVGKNVGFRSKPKLHFGPGVSFGDDSFVDAQAVNGVVFGKNVTLGRNSRIECTGSLKSIGIGFTAGDNVGLGTDNFFGSAGGIRIGAETIIGNHTSFHAENHVSIDMEIPVRLQGVERLGIEIGQNCWIGAKVTILDGTILGDSCIVAAGAVVKAGTYASGGIYAGVPAKRVKSRGESS